MTPPPPAAPRGHRYAADIADASDDAADNAAVPPRVNVPMADSTLSGVPPGRGGGPDAAGRAEAARRTGFATAGACARDGARHGLRTPPPRRFPLVG